MSLEEIFLRLTTEETDAPAADIGTGAAEATPVLETAHE
jgi:hypothetical protein